MPLYEFKCNTCDETFTELRKIGDYEGVSCPSCKGKDVRKLMSTFSSSSTSSSSHSGSCLPSGGG